METDNILHYVKDALACFQLRNTVHWNNDFSTYLKAYSLALLFIFKVCDRFLESLQSTLNTLHNAIRTNKSMHIHKVCNIFFEGLQNKQKSKRLFNGK